MGALDMLLLLLLAMNKKVPEMIGVAPEYLCLRIANQENHKIECVEVSIFEAPNLMSYIR
jgi:hypothetical protein